MNRLAPRTVTDVLGDLARVSRYERLCDRQLVEEFASKHEQAPQAARAALAELVARHGRMVMGVCRRILGQAGDAEDAFQATFLVLAKRAKPDKGAKPTPWQDTIGGWLYVTARQTALGERRMATRRRSREQQMDAAAKVDGPEVALSDAIVALDEELFRLPPPQREAVELRHLVGMTLEEAAEKIGVSTRTVQLREAAGLQSLRERLAGRGFSASAVLASLLIAGGARAGIPKALAAATAQAALRFACAGASLTATRAERLAEAVLLGAASGFQLKATGVALLAAGAVLAAAAGLLPARGEPDPPPASPPRPAATTRLQPPAPEPPRPEPREAKLREVVPEIVATIQAASPIGGSARATSARIIDGRALIRVEWFPLPPSFKQRPSVVELDFGIDDGKLKAFWDFMGDGKARQPFDWRRPSWMWGTNGQQIDLFGKEAMKKVYELLSQLQTVGPSWSAG